MIMDERINKYLCGKMSDEEKGQLFNDIDNNAELKRELIETQNIYSLAQMFPASGDRQYAETGFKQLMQRVHKIKIWYISRMVNFFITHQSYVDFESVS